MMKRILHSMPGDFYLEGEILESECGGNGSIESPSLWIRVRLRASLPQNAGRHGLLLRRINARLCLRQSRTISETAHEMNALICAGYPAVAPEQYLDFCLDSARLHELEKTRNGGDMVLRLEASIAADHLVDARPESSQANDFQWTLRQAHVLQFFDDFTIPRDAWITRVLPHVGYGKVHVVELPAVPISSSEVLKKSFDALLQAEQHHRAGRYDDAVGKCRVAVDDFVMLVDDDALGASRKTLKLRRPEWEVKLGKAASAWLAAASDALKYGGNPAHHSPNPHYDQFESQMIMCVTAALVNYAARCESE